MTGRESPSERTLRARMAAHVRWSRVSDPNAETAQARAAFLDRFERQVDPEGRLSSAERARRADHARRAYFISLARRSARVRRGKCRDEGRPS
jgi:hypothetical protein